MTMPEPTGRDLDRLVAERVMGWDYDDPGHSWGPPRWVSQDSQTIVEASDFIPSADTPEGWAAMRSVVERMLALGFKECSIYKSEHWATWEVCFIGVDDNGQKERYGEYKADSLPRAVAEAALAAIGEKDER